MRVVLQSLKISNFKGLKELEINFDGSTDIVGANGTGKTSIVDAFYWLLFGKDSRGRSTFGLKPLNPDGTMIHGVETSVLGSFLIDGVPKTIHRISKEKWEKRRGESEALFTGNTTDYKIDSIPLKKSEFDEAITQIIDEAVFKLVTTPFGFFELPWTKQREVLLSIIYLGDFDQKLLSQKRYSDLKKLVGDGDLELFKRKLASDKKLCNNELKTIPARIDEAMKSVIKYDFEALESEREVAVALIEQLQLALIDQNSPSKDALSKQKQLIEFEKRLVELEAELEIEHRKNTEGLLIQTRVLSGKANEAWQEVVEFERKIAARTIELNEVTTARDEKRQYFERTANEVFDTNADCPVCGQPLPLETIDKAKANFSIEQKAKMDSIKKTGAQLTARVDHLTAEIKTLKGQTETSQGIKNTAEGEIKALNESLKKIGTLERKLADNKERQKLIAILEDRGPHEQEINFDTYISDAQLKIDETTALVRQIDGQLSQKIRNQTVMGRIGELEQRERELSQLITDAEKLEFLIESFTRTKIEGIQNAINAKFEKINFKMFETQINGAIDETCEATVDGVPISDCNSASRVNAGLDVAHTLSQHYDFYAPIFIDNRESITEITDFGTQIINLYVVAAENLHVREGDL